MDCSTFAFDLHVLGTPPALILSQDQTLMLKALFSLTVGLRQRLQRSNWFNARPIIGSALFNPLFMKWFVASRLRTD